jgi:hypothetical protein
MFELKDQVYKVEYEGLHMLCRSCGKFGHYVEGCPNKKASTDNVKRTEEGPSTISAEAGNMKGSDINGGEGDGPWVVVQKPRRPRKAKDVSGNDGGAAGVGHTTGTGTRFDILETINEDPVINGTIIAERIGSDIQANNIPHSVHGKGKNKNVKHVGDKKGKAADKKIPSEVYKSNSGRGSQSGTPVVNNNNIQILKRTNQEELTKEGNQGKNEISQRKDDTSNHHDIIGQAPHINDDRGEGVINAHGGPHHMPRPPDNDQVGQACNHNTIGPNNYEGETQDQRIGEEDMEIIPETPNLDQQEGGAKSMILA